MPRIAFVAREGALCGAEEAGLPLFTVEEADRLEEQVVALAAKGFAMIVVTEDLVGDRLDSVTSRLLAAAPEACLLVVPGPGGTEGRHLAFLRSRLAAAIGVDVWGATASRKGLEI